MGVKFNHQEVIDEVFEKINSGLPSWNSLLISADSRHDYITIEDREDGDKIYLHIDQAQKLKEILNEVLM